LLLPLEDASTGRGGFGRLDVAGLLQGDGERGVGQRVIGREDGERQGRANRLAELARVAQGADQAVMGLDVGRVGGNGGAKGLGCICR